MLCTTPACFSTFFSIYHGPYSSWKFQIFLVNLFDNLFDNFFENNIIMIMIIIVEGGTASWTL